ncbi:L-rhamnose-1-dehydrogenase [Elasticomyces elasticus]|nr:L-rhamnose-1-dehydrogenase [Elasticomyces elasticus]
MLGLLSGKVVIITGCSSGIGRAIAIECAAQGAKLVLHHIGDAQALGDIKTLRIELDQARRAAGDDRACESVDIGIDITQETAGQEIVDAATKTFGEVNVLVHNAGIAQFEDFVRVSRPQLKRHMDINFGGPFFLSQAVVQQMITQGSSGSVVSIASVTATFGASQLAHYAATKAAVLGMTASCAVGLGRYGIRFNAVSPGTIETAMNSKDLAGAKRDLMEAHVPLGRLGMPEDIAKPVAFLASDMARYVTGQNLIVDGGATLNYQ